MRNLTIRTPHVVISVGPDEDGCDGRGMYCACELREIAPPPLKKLSLLGRPGHRFRYDNIFLILAEAFLLFQKLLTDSQQTNLSIRTFFPNLLPIILIYCQYVHIQNMV
jgi:hypothetical protein